MDKYLESSLRSSKPEESYHIRWMIRRDMPEVLDIENLSFDYPWAEEDFIMCLRRRDCIGMVIENRDESIAGYMLYNLLDNDIELINIAVHPHYRRQGCGAAMLDKLKGKLSPQRRKTLCIVTAETNLDTQLFLRSQDLKCVKIIQDYFEGDKKTGYLFKFRIGYDNVVPYNRMKEYYYENYQRK